jgi:hypothetical protein
MSDDWMDMPGHNDIIWPGTVLHSHGDRQSAIKSRNPRGHTPSRLDRGPKHMVLGTGPPIAKKGNSQLTDFFLGQHKANQPTRMGRHKINCLRSHVFSRDTQVRLALLILLVDEDYYFSLAQVRECFFNWHC